MSYIVYTLKKLEIQNTKIEHHNKLGCKDPKEKAL